MIPLKPEEALAVENGQLKEQLKNMEAEKIALDGTAMELMKANHQLKTQFILLQHNHNLAQQGLSTLSKQYADLQDKLNQSEEKLKGLHEVSAGLAVQDDCIHENIMCEAV